MSYEELNNKLEEWLLELEYDEKSDNTLKKYKVNVSSFIEFIKEKDLTKKTYLEFIKNLEVVEEYLPNTSNSYIVAINKFLKWLGLKDLIIKQLKLQQDSSINDYLSLSDCKRLLRIAKRKEQMDNYFIIQILFKTGIRISELKYFTVENLDTVIVIKNKGKIRNIPVVSDLVRELKKYAKSKNITSGNLFTNPKTGKIYVQSTIW